MRTRLLRVAHKWTLTGVCALTVVFWVSGYVYLRQERNSLEKLQLENQTRAQEVAWKAVVTTHRTAMQAYFDSYIMVPENMAILRAALAGNRDLQDRQRVKLYRKLFSTYEMLRQRDVRQLHFHTPDNRSFLRFHSPHNSGDSLVASRPSVVAVNKYLKAISGFETGRIIIGFRNVYPIVWQGKHLGSVELSQPFDAIRKGMRDLDPSKEHLLVLKGSVLLPKLLEEHKRLYASSLFNPDWLVEDPQGELPDSSPPLSSAAFAVYRELKNNKSFKTALTALKPATLTVRNEGQSCLVTMLPLYDTDGKNSALLLVFARSPEHEELYATHRINLVAFTVMTIFAGSALFLFLNSIQIVWAQDQELALVSSNIADGIYVMNEQGIITFVNQRASELLGFTQEEFKGQIAHDMFHVHEGDEQFPIEKCPVYQVIQTRQRYEGEELFAHKNGSLLTVQVASQPMLKADRIVGSVTVFRDITEQKRLEEQMRLLSATDPLTGVYNRRFFQESLLKEIARAERHTGSFALVMLDLDHFKLVNDRYGHDAGDRVLRHLVTVISGRIRSSDCLARWGGEEFLLLLPNTSLREATALAEALCDALRHSEIAGVGVVTASFGVTAYRSGYTVMSLVKRSDDLMYAAKQAGRNCVRSDVNL